jgi:hypothetical protein
MPPNLAWCEERLCQWVVTPANAWSNLAYILVAIWLVREIKKNRETGVLGYYGKATFAVGMSSFIYHASYTFFFQVFDFIGMYLFLFLPLTTQLRSLQWISEGTVLPIYLGATAFFTALTVAFYFIGFPAQSLVALLVLMVVGLELLRRRQMLWGGKAWTPWNFGAAFAFLLAGATLSALDISGKFCDPSNHWLQGHSLWHLFTATSLIFVFKHFRTERFNGA